MPEENVEVARAAIDAWNRGDREAWLESWDEGAEFHPLRAQLEGRAYRGHGGMRRFMSELDEDWDGVRFEIDDLREEGGQVVGTGRMRARGRVSGVELDVPLGLIGTVRDGKIVHARMFSDPGEALEAAGLSR
jgi:ketosteroid isomerase-like protein